MGWRYLLNVHLSIENNIVIIFRVLCDHGKLSSYFVFYVIMENCNTEENSIQLSLNMFLTYYRKLNYVFTNDLLK